MTNSTHAPTPWILPDNAPRLRIASRPEKFRQENFAEMYDSTTICYDCFWLVEGEIALLVGPPFLNLKNDIVNMRIIAKPSGAACQFRVRDLDRHSQIRVNTPRGTESLSIESALGDISLRPGDNQSDIFDGKRVLLTPNKDNRPSWICDWVRFYRDVHGANAVLLYDNASSTYSAAQLCEQLSALAGIEAVHVVQWPFKFGPQSYFGKYWDSDYCQIGMYEDARWRFLQRARSVLNCDIDELVVTSDRAHGSIFQLTETSRRGYVRFYGKWIVALADKDDQPSVEKASAGLNRHKDYEYALSVYSAWQKYRFVSQNRCASKWAVVPARCGDNSQWKTHVVTRILQASLPLEKIGFRHFREINTSWKYRRFVRENFDSKKHSVDSELISAFSRVDWDS